MQRASLGIGGKIFEGLCHAKEARLFDFTFTCL
jgi:hypothetical protein